MNGFQICREKYLEFHIVTAWRCLPVLISEKACVSGSFPCVALVSRWAGLSQGCLHALVDKSQRSSPVRDVLLWTIEGEYLSDD